MDAGHETSAGRILVGIDGSESSLAALRWADMMAVRLGLGLRVAMAWSHPDNAITGVGDPVAEMHERTRRRIADAVRSAGCGSAELSSLQGRQPERAFLEAETDPDVAMVVVGTRGLGPVPGLLLGSFSRQILWHTVRPLVLIPQAAGSLTNEIGHVVIGTDRSRPAQYAIHWAAEICGTLGATATVIRCLDPGAELPLGRLAEINDRARVEIDESCGTFRSRGVSYEALVTNADPRPKIIEVAAATGAGLIVVGKRGDSQLAAVGGTASYLIRHSPLPLAVIPSTDHPMP
jgi:nucleotide-binding universal stress UspA family protein